MKLLGWMHSKLRQKRNDQQPQNNTSAIIGNYGEEMVVFDEIIFPGFLAIGTLGNYETISNIITDEYPPTPTFPFEHVETEKEVKFIINDNELEKVNTEASSIALGDDNKHIIINMEECPLQKYLLASSVESEVKLKQQKGFPKDKKKNAAAHFMKKILKNLQPKSNLSSTESLSSNKKLPQVLKMFYRKVHPVNENNVEDNEISNSIVLGAISEVKTNFSPKEEVIINREHWIKTDRDYLVLEL